MSHPIDTLGFRPPQFSEDLAWIPNWLHQHQKDELDDCINNVKGTNLDVASQALKFFEGKTNEEKDGNMLSCDEGNRYHLFLSGEDSPAVGFASSPGNVLHLHLHLSSNGSSQCSPIQRFDASQNHLESSRVVPLQLNDTSVGLKVKTCSEISPNVGGISSLPIKSVQKPLEDVPQCPSNNKMSESHFGRKLNARHLKSADITEAVELSIAASEALVINDILKSELASEVFSTETVLEAALQLKKSRWKWFEDDFDSPADETAESNSLSDLDDFTMADVYEDVGLSQSGPTEECAFDLSISQVKETPASQNQYDCVNLCDSLELRAQNVKFDDICVRKQVDQNPVLDIIRSREDLRPESVNCEREEFHNTHVLGSNIGIVARHYPSALKSSDVLIVKQIVDAMVDITSYQSQNNLNSRPHAWDSGNAKREDTGTSLASSRFRSRWLGGWTAQDVSASPECKPNAKGILKCFAGETSFLSESAEIAPDMNSFVQVHESESYISASSIHFAGLHDELNKGILLSQEVVRSSISLVDPLCSVVPCSISSENGSRTFGHNQKDKESDAEECIRPTPELGVDNSHKSPDLVIEFHHRDGQTIPTTNDECPPVTVRRQLVSLRTYSTRLPNHVSILDGGSLYHNQLFNLECDQLIPSNKNASCIRSFDKTGFKESLPFNHVSFYTAGSSNEGNSETNLNGNRVSRTKNQKRNYYETSRDGNELPVHAVKKRRKPLIFDHTATLRLHALLPENAVLQHKELQNMQSEFENFHDRDVSVKKRARFSQLEIPVQSNKNLEKLDSSTKNCTIARVSKKWKFSKLQSQEKNLANCQSQSGNRLLFQGVEFLLTGFSSQKEMDIARQIWKHGGIVLSDIPSLNSRAKRSFRSNGHQLPIILCLKKLQTTKFLFGCAVNAFILKADWLTNSISANCIVPPEKYMILPNRAGTEHITSGRPFHQNRNYVFERVGIMLHGKHSFYSKLAKIVKHAGGRVFKTLQWLVHSLDKEKVSLGAIVADNESRTSRHLRHCASEQNLPIVTVSWIIKSLHLGKLLPFPGNRRSSFPTIKIPKIPEIPVSRKMSEDAQNTTA